MLVPLLGGLAVALGVWLALDGLLAPPPTHPPPARRRRRGRPGWEQRLTVRLAAADLPPTVSPRRFLLMSALSGLGLAALALSASRQGLLASVALVAGAYAPVVVLDLLAGRRERQIELDLEAAIGLIGAVMGQVGTTIQATIAELAARGPLSLRPAFAEASSAARQGGLPAGLAVLRRRLGPSADDLCEALALADELGLDPVPRLLAQLTNNQRETRSTREKILLMQRRALLEANTLTIAPWAIIGIGLLFGPPEYRAAWETPLGSLGIIAILGLVLLGRIGQRLCGQVRLLHRQRRLA